MLGGIYEICGYPFNQFTFWSIGNFEINNFWEDFFIYRIVIHDECWVGGTKLAAVTFCEHLQCTYSVFDHSN